MAKLITKKDILNDPEIQAKIQQAQDEAIEKAMAVLTPEQKDYFDLRTAMTNMFRVMEMLQNEGKITVCIPWGDNPLGAKKRHPIENVFYGYMDRLMWEKKNGLVSYKNEQSDWITEEINYGPINDKDN